MSDAIGATFSALADPSRRRMLGLLGGTGATATQLARELPISRQMVLKHLGVLQDSGLVSSARAGREVLFQVRSTPLAETADWLSSLAAQWDSRLAALKARAEQAEPRGTTP
jgi:DNA-binding transcriptional ArsR family regulator